MSQALLAVENLSAGYGLGRVLFDVSLRVEPGEVVLLTGRNGAGKSTTLKAIMGLLPDRQGRIALDGRDVSLLQAHHLSRLGIGWVPEDRRIFADLTVNENLEVGRRVRADGRRRWSPQGIFELFPNLAGMGSRPAGRMSGGEQQMLAIARTLMGNPFMLLLDEPSEGLAPAILDMLARALHTLRHEGVSVLLAEQNVRFAERVASRAYLLETGRITKAGELPAFRMPLPIYDDGGRHADSAHELARDHRARERTPRG
jgi:branched-chain amino acid transport system ATP-binding protein